MHVLLLYEDIHHQCAILLYILVTFVSPLFNSYILFNLCMTIALMVELTYFSSPTHFSEQLC